MVTLTSFTTARLNHLLSFVEQLVQMIAANHLIAATKGLTIATPRHIENEERLETTEKGFKERKKELVAMGKRQMKFETTLGVVQSLARLEGTLAGTD